MQTEQTRRGSAHPAVGRRVPSSNESFFEPEELREVRDYLRPLRRNRRIRFAVTTAVDLAVVFVLDLPPRIAAWTDAPWPLQLLLIAVVLDLVSTIVAAPFNWWANLVYEKRAGHSTMTPAVWVKDRVVELALGLVVTAVVAIPLYAAIRATEWWWLVGTALILVVQVVLQFLAPVLILPRFNTFTPMPEGPIRTRIEEIARLSGVRIEGVYLMDASKRTTRPNAGVTGFGKTKRVVVNDTICDFPLEELSQVIAHELGHYRLNHIPKSFPIAALQFPLVLLAIELVAGNSTVLRWAGADALGDPASYGLFNVVFGGALVVASLPQAWLSRKHEREADLEALELLGDPTSFTKMWPRMALTSKATLEPTWWERAKGTHPEIAERMQFGVDWAEMNGVPMTRPAKRSVAALDDGAQALDA